MAQWWGDGDFDWTDAVLLVICTLLVGALGYTVYSMNNTEPIIITHNITITEIEVIYVNRTIAIPVVEYEIIEVEVPIYINNTKIVEISPPPPTPLMNFESKKDLILWILVDTTDKIDYDNRWNCMDFTLRTIENANKDGYRVIFVYWQNMNGEIGKTHAVCMAYVEKEAAYICWEPQTDSILWEWTSTVGG